MHLISCGCTAAHQRSRARPRPATTFSSRRPPSSSRRPPASSASTTRESGRRLPTPALRSRRHALLVWLSQPLHQATPPRNTAQHASDRPRQSSRHRAGEAGTGKPPVCHQGLRQEEGQTEGRLRQEESQGRRGESAPLSSRSRARRSTPRCQCSIRQTSDIRNGVECGDVLGEVDLLSGEGVGENQHAAPSCVVARATRPHPASPRALVSPGVGDRLPELRQLFLIHALEHAARGCPGHRGEVAPLVDDVARLARFLRGAVRAGISATGSSSDSGSSSTSSWICSRVVMRLILPGRTSAAKTSLGIRTARRALTSAEGMFTTSFSCHRPKEPCDEDPDRTTWRMRRPGRLMR